MKRASPFPLFLALALMVGVSCSLFSNSTPAPNTNDDRTLKFIPDDLPEVQQGVAYEAEIKIENVHTFVGQFVVSDGALPPGLSLERVEGENAVKIIGMPAEKGQFACTLQAICVGTNEPGQEGKRLYQIVVK